MFIALKKCLLQIFRIYEKDNYKLKIIFERES